MCHLEVVKALLSDPRVDPSADNNYAIRYASQNGYLEVIKLLKEHEQKPRESIEKCNCTEEIKKLKSIIKKLKSIIYDDSSD
jgi:hypothetical protein